MKKSTIIELLWDGGIYLLLTVALVLFLVLLRYLPWKVSGSVAIGVVVVGTGVLIYFTNKVDKEENRGICSACNCGQFEPGIPSTICRNCGHSRKKHRC